MSLANQCRLSRRTRYRKRLGGGGSIRYLCGFPRNRMQRPAHFLIRNGPYEQVKPILDVGTRLARIWFVLKNEFGLSRHLCANSRLAAARMAVCFAKWVVCPHPKRRLFPPFVRVLFPNSRRGTFSGQFDFFLTTYRRSLRQLG